MFSARIHGRFLIFVHYTLNILGQKMSNKVHFALNKVVLCNISLKSKSKLLTERFISIWQPIILLFSGVSFVSNTTRGLYLFGIDFIAGYIRGRVIFEMRVLFD